MAELGLDDLRLARPPFPLRGQNCQCRACGLLFRAVSTFDRHRVGPYTDRRCLTSIELADKGWQQDSKGFWRRPGPPTEVSRVRP